MGCRMKLAWVMVVVALVARGALAEEAVVVKKSPASIELRSFDPKHLPKEMPPLNKNEAAVTETSYGCGAQIEVETKTVDGKPVKTTVVSVRVRLSLDVTEWLPKEVTPKIKAHEDGHRKISELYYENAEKAAQAVAQKFVGREVDPTDADVQANIKKLATEVCQEYLGLVEKPEQRAQELFDQVTDHGRNTVPEKRAIEKAVQQSQKEIATTRKAG